MVRACPIKALKVSNVDEHPWLRRRGHAFAVFFF